MREEDVLRVLDELEEGRRAPPPPTHRPDLAWIPRMIDTLRFATLGAISPLWSIKSNPDSGLTLRLMYAHRMGTETKQHLRQAVHYLCGAYAKGTHVIHAVNLDDERTVTITAYPHHERPKGRKR